MSRMLMHHPGCGSITLCSTGIPTKFQTSVFCSLLSFSIARGYKSLWQRTALPGVSGHVFHLALRTSRWVQPWDGSKCVIVIAEDEAA